MQLCYGYFNWLTCPTRYESGTQSEAIGKCSSFRFIFCFRRKGQYILGSSGQMARRSATTLLSRNRKIAGSIPA
jgi:hypothetical protein